MYINELAQRVVRTVSLAAPVAFDPPGEHSCVHDKLLFKGVFCEVHCSTEDACDKQHRHSCNEHSERFCE